VFLIFTFNLAPLISATLCTLKLSPQEHLYCHYSQTLNFFDVMAVSYREKLIEFLILAKSDLRV
jgi:hypothetical protein